MKINLNKKGASVIIGYVLLVTLGLVMSGIAYNYLKTYVPQEIIDCPADASLFIQEWDCNGDILNITIKNNGKFNLDGFFIHSADNAKDEIATDNLIYIFDGDSSDNALVQDSLKYIRISMGKPNYLKPGKTNSYWFDFGITPSSGNTIAHSKIIEITPTILKFDNGYSELALCSNAKIRQTIECT